MQQQEIVAGDSLNFTVVGGAYPAGAGWVLSYLLVPRAAGAAITFGTTANGDDFVAAQAASTTAAWPAGQYTWFQRVEKSGEKYTVGEGQLTIKPNPELLSGAFDGRSQAQRALEEARAAYASFSASSGTKKRYRIGDRELEFSSAAEIVKTINYWEVQVSRERRNKALAAGLPDPSKTYVRLSRG